MSLIWKRRRKQDRDQDRKEAKDVNEDFDKAINKDFDEDIDEATNKDVIEDVDEGANENVNENEYMKVEGRKKVRSWIPKSIHHWYPQPP